VEIRTRSGFPLRAAAHGKAAAMLARPLLCRSYVTSRASLERRVGYRELLGAAGGLGFAGVSEVRVTRSRTPGTLPAPLSAHVAGDGRALAWFGAERACIVHPTLAELCRMHGVEVEATLAA
jgi:hypothetical protein